jgi:hypothetical protein
LLRDKISNLIDLLHFLGGKLEHIYQFQTLDQAFIIETTFGAVETGSHGRLLVLVERVGHLGRGPRGQARRR